MSIDNTHTKYLKGKDKKAWSGFKDAYESAQRYANFTKGLSMPDMGGAKEIEIPIRKPSKEKDNKTTK